MRARILSVAFRKAWVGLAFCALVFVVSAYAGPQHLYVRIPTSLITADFVNESDFIRDHKWDDTYSFGYLSSEKYNQLNASLQKEMVLLDTVAWASQDYDPKTLRVRTGNPKRANTPYEDYHTYESLTSDLHDLAAKYPQLMSVTSAGKSTEGRDLWVVRLSNIKNGIPNKPKLLYVSSMHGDETVGKELLVYLIRDFLAKYRTDQTINALLNYADIFIMPSMNPDGTNLRQRFNSTGVDLNRDFPGLDEQPFSKTNRAPETIALMELHRNNHFLIAMNMHTGALCVNIPWDSKPNPQGSPDNFGDDLLMNHIAHEYADQNLPMHNFNDGNFVNGVTYGYEWYQVLGGMQDWASFFQQSTHATLELNDVKWPDASSLPQLWTDNRSSMISYLQHGIEGIHLKVTDEAGTLLKVNVDVGSATRTLTYTGYVHRPTLQGVQHVTLKADGYKTQTFDLESSAFDGTYKTVTLQKQRLVSRR